jgi:hypothetical protein
MVRFNCSNLMRATGSAPKLMPPSWWIAWFPTRRRPENHRTIRQFSGLRVPIKLAALIVVLPAVAAGAMLGLASSASAAPYGTTTLTVTVGNTIPGPGQTTTVTVTGAIPGDPINIDIDSTPIRLGTFTTTSTGTATGRISIPCGLSGDHSIVATDSVTSASASTPVTVDPSMTRGSCLVSTSLASTGFDLVGITSIALTMLGTGALVLCFGRRRVAPPR